MAKILWTSELTAEQIKSGFNLERAFPQKENAYTLQCHDTAQIIGCFTKQGKDYYGNIGKCLMSAIRKHFNPESDISLTIHYLDNNEVEIIYEYMADNDPETFRAELTLSLVTLYFL